MTTDTTLMPLFWRCWRCGGQHPNFEARCPNGSPHKDAPTREQMKKRLNRFLMAYADQCEVRNDGRVVNLKREGMVPIAEAVRRETIP